MAEFPPYRIQQVADLLPAAMNARTHTDEQVEQIVRSIKEFGFTNPLIVDDQNNVLAGNGRLLAAHKLGMVQVPTIKMSDMTPEQKRAYMLADNRLALNAGWDDDILRAEIANLRNAGFDVDITGFGELDIDQLFAAESDPNALWQGMPEFDQPNAIYRTIIVHFKNDDDVEAFKKLVNQPQITAVTKFIWFPPDPKFSYTDKHYTTETPEDQPDNAQLAKS